CRKLSFCASPLGFRASKMTCEIYSVIQNSVTQNSFTHSLNHSLKFKALSPLKAVLAVCNHFLELPLYPRFEGMPSNITAFNFGADRTRCLYAGICMDEQLDAG